MSNVRIAVKYCGGCNPDFDRVEAVAAMLEKLAHVVEVVPLDGGSADVLVAVEGCPAACANLSGVKAARTVILASREAIKRFVAEFQSPGRQSPRGRNPRGRNPRTPEPHFPEDGDRKSEALFSKE